MIVIDLETTGLDEKECGIASIGAVSWPEGEEYYIEPQILPEAKIEKKALAVNGFTEKSLYDPEKPYIADAINDFNDWTMHAKDRIIGSWNALFEVKFLKVAYGQGGIEWNYGYRVSDLHSLTYGMMQAIDDFVPMHNGVGTVGLNYARKHYGLPPEPEPHNALTGAQSALDVWNHLQAMIKGGIEIEQKPDCPKCSTPNMVKRVPKPDQTWSAFWGCSDWPKCDGTRKYEEPKEVEQLELT